MSGMGASCDDKDGSSPGIFWDEPRENNAGDVIDGVAQGDCARFRRRRWRRRGGAFKTLNQTVVPYIQNVCRQSLPRVLQHTF